MEKIETDICVIGAGSGGLSVAAGASQMGARVVLLEKHKMGGDCLNYGCVPSKALISAGKHAHAMTAGGSFGVSPVEPQINFSAAMDHVENVIKGIEPVDSVERFEGLGVKVVQEAGRFSDSRTVIAGNKEIKAKRFVIATGSRAGIPPIEGLETVPFMTNETVFENRTRPDHLIVIGGGPIGMELAQAHCRLGARVTLVEMFDVLGRDDREQAQVIIDTLRREGVDVRERTRIVRAEMKTGQPSLVIEKDGVEEVLIGSHLLVAAGRVPNVDDLGLEDAGVRYTAKGIEVDARLRTTNKKIFAIGDVKGGLQFTHVAGYDAGIVIRNILFRMPAKADYKAVPKVTYTEPELSSVGLGENEARSTHGDIRILRWHLGENDRAAAEGVHHGSIKVITAKNGKILGASIAAPNGGELLAPWTLAITNNMKIGAMASVIAPYPTMGEMSKRAAGSFYTPSLFSPRIKKIVRFLLKLG